MDLGFARRSQSRASAVDPAAAYRMLLASVAAQQAISPTAQVQAAIGRKTNHAAPAFFTSVEPIGTCKPHSASFHAAVAGTIAAECKSL